MLILSSVVNQHAPFKRASRREKRLQQKPWLTRLLLKSVKQKNIIYANLKQKYTKTNFKSYKICRNILNRAIQAAKQSYNQNIVHLIKNCQINYGKCQ